MTRLGLADTLAFPLDAVTQMFAVLAVRGAGKTILAAVMAEEFYRATLPFVVVDPVGAVVGASGPWRTAGPGWRSPSSAADMGDVPLGGTDGDPAEWPAELRVREFPR
jgi:DNA helicase HerA-like ATPase